MTLAIDADEVAQLPPPEPGVGSFRANVGGGRLSRLFGRVLETGLGVRDGGIRPARWHAEARVEFSLPARAESVPLVRHALAGLAEAVEMDPSEIADLKTVVTEACMNVGRPRLSRRDDGRAARDRGLAQRTTALVVTVRDFGEGIRPLADVEQSQPAPRPAADRGAHGELRDQRRPGARDGGDDARAAVGRTAPRAPRASRLPSRSRRRGSTCPPASCWRRCSRG